MEQAKAISLAALPFVVIVVRAGKVPAVEEVRTPPSLKSGGERERDSRRKSGGRLAWTWRGRRRGRYGGTFHHFFLANPFRFPLLSFATISFRQAPPTAPPTAAAAEDTSSRGTNDLAGAHAHTHAHSPGIEIGPARCVPGFFRVPGWRRRRRDGGGCIRRPRNWRRGSWKDGRGGGET